MNRTFAMAASLWLALPLAASGAPQPPVAAADDLRDDAPPRIEWTVSGTAQSHSWLVPVPGLTITALTGDRVYELSGGHNLPRLGAADTLALSLFAGWNHPMVGQARQGA